jgi:hypothetical protein
LQARENQAPRGLVDKLFVRCAMKALVLIVALGFTAAAQTTTNVPGVTLSGPVANPVIENHSGKQIIAAMLMLTHADGQVEQQMNTFIEHNTEIPDAVANEIPDGGSKVWHTASKHQKVTNPVIAAEVAAVIFDDGELRGQDAYQFRALKEREFQRVRQAWQMAKAGNWDGVKAQAEANTGDIVGVVAAERLLWEKSNHGEAEAVKSLAHYGLLPASTWKGGLLNRLRIVPDLFQAIEV